MIFKKCISILFLVIAYFNLHSQSTTLHFGHLNVEDGLSHNSISKITQDKYGFIWFTSYVGLNRYDGHNFEVFLHDEKDTTSLSSNIVWGMTAGEDGSVWVGTSKGLNRYDYDSNSFQKIELENSTGVSFNIWDIKEDQEGNIWVGTRGNGLYKVSARNKTGSTRTFAVKNYRHDPHIAESLPSNTIGFIHPRGDSEKNEIVVLADHTAGIFNVEDEKFHTYNNKLKGESEVSTFSSVASSNKNILWYGTNNSGILKYGPSGNFIGDIKHDPNNPQSLFSNTANVILFDRKENVWVGILGKGLSVSKDGEKEIFDNYQYDINNPTGLSSNNIGPLYEDKEGNIWIGTNGGGVNYYNPNQYNFPLFRSNQKLNNSICSNQLRAIFEDSHGKTWLSSSVNGINTFEFDSTGQEIINLKHYTTSADHTIKNLSCHHFFESQDGHLLMCNREIGLVVYDYEENQFRNFLYQKGDLDLINNIRVYSIIENERKYLFGTSNGIYFYDKHSKQTGILNQQSEVQDLIINTLYEDKEGLIYLGTPNYGFQVFDPGSDSTVIHLPEGDPKTSLGSKHIISFLPTSDDCYWIGTWDGGLSKYNPQNHTFKTYDESDGLSNNTIYSIQEDQDKKLWLSTNKGLAVFDPRSEIFKNFDTSYNLQGEEFNSRVGFSSKSGRMYFGGMDGLNVFNPDEIFSDNKPPKMLITELVKYQFRNGRSSIRKEKNILNKSSVELHHYDKTLQFKFSALKLPKLYNTVFDYQLEGFNSKWINLGKRSEVNLTNLAQGTYQLRIRAVNTNNDWSPQEISLTLKMYPPWWKTYWAYALYAFLVLSIFYFIYNYRLSQILKYQSLRTKISSDLHDDVGSILTAASMQTEILSWSLPEEHLGTFEKIGQLNKQAMEQMRDTVWAIDSRKDNIESLLDRMQDFAFDIPENDRIEILFEDNLANKERKLLPNIRQNIYLIYKEALNNALKHSNGNQINVRLESTNSILKLVVKDNGVIDQNKQMKTSGLGIQNMKMRTANIQGTIDFSYHDGFQISCSVPFK